MAEATAQLQAVERQLEEAYGTWEDLEERAAAAAGTPATRGENP